MWRMSMKLYELTNEYKALTSLLESDDNIEEEKQVRNLLNEITTQLNVKAENIAKLILSLNADMETIDSEVKRLVQRKTSLNNKIEYLKSYLLEELVKAQVDKIKGSVVNISIRNNPPSCNILDFEKIPTEYKREIPAKWEADKSKILTNFKTTGEIIDGVEIIKDKKCLVIK